jgi:hypothetical protein
MLERLAINTETLWRQFTEWVLFNTELTFFVQTPLH